MANNPNNNNNKNPFSKGLIVTFVRLLVLALLAWGLVSLVKLIFGS